MRHKDTFLYILINSGDKEKIKVAAEKENRSVANFVLNCVTQQMQGVADSGKRKSQATA